MWDEGVRDIILMECASAPNNEEGLIGSDQLTLCMSDCSTRHVADGRSNGCQINSYTLRCFSHSFGYLNLGILIFSFDLESACCY